MSNYLTGLAQLNPQVKRHNGGTTTLTLDENGTTNATMLFVNGVAQSPGTDFNVSGATLTTTSTLPAGTNICTTIQYFNTGVVNTVADDAIGLGQMASGTDGNLITYDASGNPAHVATGNDGQVLTSAGAGAAPVFEDAGGGWSFVSSVIISSSTATASFTGLGTGYDYQMYSSNVTPVTDAAEFRGQLGITGPTYRTSNYLGAQQSFRSNSATVNYAVRTGYFPMDGYTAGNASNEEGRHMITFHDPANASLKTNWNNNASNEEATGTGSQMIGGGIYTTAEAHTAIKFYFATGNIANGIFKLYKRANA